VTPGPAAPRPDDDEPWSTPAERLKRRELAHLFRHQLLFMVGILLGMAGGLAAASSRIASVVLFVLAGVGWAASGVSAIAARRHMFGSIGPVMAGNTWVRPSGTTRVGSIVVGVILMLLALGLVNVAVSIALA
jgi:hypothetical protein